MLRSTELHGSPLGCPCVRLHKATLSTSARITRRASNRTQPPTHSSFLTRYDHHTRQWAVMETRQRLLQPRLC